MTFETALSPIDLATWSRHVAPVKCGAPGQSSDAFRPFEPVHSPEGLFRFKFRVPDRLTYSVETSADLKNWQEVCTGISRGHVIRCADSEAHQFRQQFYRLRCAGIFSESVVGYASIDLPPGHSMISNPFRGTSAIKEIFRGWPNGTRLSRFDTTLFRLIENRLHKGEWTEPEASLAAGEGALFFNPTAERRTVTLCGGLMDGRHTIPIPSGFCIRGSSVPVRGALDELGFPLQNGDVIHLLDRERQKYVLHQFENGAWSNGPAVVEIGEAFWVAKCNAAAWTVNLSPFNLTV